MTTTFGTISHRTGVYVMKGTLAVAKDNNLLGKVAQNYVIPKGGSDTAKWRRYEKLALPDAPLVEGVTPTAIPMTKTDIQQAMQEWGAYVEISNKVRDNVDDDVLNGEAIPLLGMQSAKTIDMRRYGVFKAGNTVFYANDSATASVNTPAAVDDFHKIARWFMSVGGDPITTMVEAGNKINTVSVMPAFRCYVHPDCVYDLEKMTGFTKVKDYASQKDVQPTEFGSFGQFRFEWSTNIEPTEDGGGAKGTTKSTTGTYSDVYPILIVAQNAWGVVGLGGPNAIQTFVHLPGSAGTADPLNQRATAGWRGMWSAKIIQELWCARLEVAVTADASIT